MRRSPVIPALAAAAIAGVAASTFVTPWLSARGIRALFDADARRTRAETARHAPTTGIDVMSEIEYSHGLSFDLVRPNGASESLPVVVWIHGGAWISGSRLDVLPFARILAARGFAVVAIDYPLAPEGRYPLALLQLNNALAVLVRRADDFGIDPSRVILAGDSAGAQLASQLAVLATNPAYAEQLRMSPPSTRVSGVVLACGIFDLDAMAETAGLGGWGIKAALWSYVGERDWEHTVAARQMSTIRHLTGDFPPAFVCAGTADELTARQSIPLISRLRELCVETTVDLPPGMPHEYQFHLDHAHARATLDNMVAFMHSVTRAA